MANRRYIDFPIASTSGDTDIILIWQGGANKQTTKATFLSGLPENLDELNDVAISGLTNGQILRYDSVTGKWENTDQGNLDLNDLNDVSIVSPSNGQVLVYNSSTSKWENSSGGFVPYTGAVTTVNLGAQTIQAGSFVKAGGTSAQFLKADGSVDSNTYGTGTVTSVALTMPAAFSVANSPVTTSGTLAVTGAGNASQYIAGDGTLVTFPALTGYVPYTGANQTVNLNTQQLQAGHTTLTTNGSTDTLTINHTSGSGKAINVTKGGAGEGLYVNKTSGSGNAATIVGTLEATTLVKTGGTSSQFLKADGSVDSTSYGTGTVTSVGLSSATSGVTIGSTPVTTSGTITLAIATASGSQNGLLSSTDWTTFNGKQNALTNPVTGTGTTNYLPKFTGSTTIGNSQVIDNGSQVGIGINPQARLQVFGGTGAYPTLGTNVTNSLFISRNDGLVGTYFGYAADGNGWIQQMRNDSATAYNLVLQPVGGNVLIGTTTDGGARLQIVSSGIALNIATGNGQIANINSTNANGGYITWQTSGTTIADLGTAQQIFGSGGNDTFGINGRGARALTFGTNDTERMRITSGGNVGIGTTNSTGQSSTNRSLQIYGAGIGNRAQIHFVNSDTGETASDGTFIGIDVNKEFFINNAENAATVFENNGGESMRITSGRNVLIGTTTDAGSKLIINQSGIAWAQIIDHSNASAQFYIDFRYNGVGTGSIIGYGTFTNFNTTSDYRLKEDLKKVNGLEKIKAINIYNYKFKESEIRMDGVLAHELAEVLPYAVTGQKNGIEMQGVDYSKLVPIMVKAIQELKQEIDTLKN